MLDSAPREGDMIDYILPGRMVTPLELLRFHADAFVGLAKNLHDMEVSLYTDQSQKQKTPIEDLGDYAKSLLFAKFLCEQIQLPVSTKHAEELIDALKHGDLGSADVHAFHENIERELGCRVFLSMTPAAETRFSNSRKGWEEILAVFPDATEDVEEMNKCFALSRYSASIFHALLVAEHGVVRLGRLLGVTDPKEGWDATSKKLQKVVDGGHDNNTSGVDFSFLEQVNVCLQVMKHAWRNKVTHVAGRPIVIKSEVADYIAEEMITATRAFMRRLTDQK